MDLNLNVNCNLSNLTLEGLYELRDSILLEIERRETEDDEYDSEYDINNSSQETEYFEEAMYLLDYPPEDMIQNVLRIEGLSTRLSVDKVIEQLSRFGEIIEVVLARDSKGKLTGRAYILTSPGIASLLARSLNNTELDGLIINVVPLISC